MRVDLLGPNQAGGEGGRVDRIRIPLGLEAQSAVLIVHGAALALLASGILRVLYFGQGSSFYTENPLFWWKVGVYLSVGALSIYPTITYILWAIPLRKGELPKVSEALATRLSWVLNVELVGFALIPLLATLMARGVGLPSA